MTLTDLELSDLFLALPHPIFEAAMWEDEEPTQEVLFEAALQDAESIKAQFPRTFREFEPEQLARDFMRRFQSQE